MPMPVPSRIAVTMRLTDRRMTGKVNRNRPLTRMAWAVFLFTRNFSLKGGSGYDTCKLIWKDRNAERCADLF